MGLPLALEFARYFKVIGFDTNKERIQLIKQKKDPSKELVPSDFEGCDIEFTDNPSDLTQAHFHIIAVPTDIDKYKVPDLKPLKEASAAVGKVLKMGDVVVFESTVYPGCTEEECLPVLEQQSGLTGGRDFKYGYSPERISPGEKNRTLSKILKIVSGNDEEALELIAEVYDAIIKAGIYKAKSIKVAEAAKVIENVQRDINISFMNELAIVFDKMGIDTTEVIEAAGTKWNFHTYRPGLVGGHCISVDPFYLIHKAKELGYNPKVIAAGRTINDMIPQFIGEKVVHFLKKLEKDPAKCRVLVLGIAFKENISDIRNSKVIDLIHELQSYSMEVLTFDPRVTRNDLKQVHNITMVTKPEGLFDAIIIAVPHDEFKGLEKQDLEALANGELVLFDIKGIKNKEDYQYYWRL